jgi:four helix bundle protein
MRDHTKLRAFELADDLALAVYQCTVDFPKHEQFGLTNQIRRGAVSAASNIVEGCARHSEADYLRFLDMAFGSAREVEYQLSLAFRLGYLTREQFDFVHPKAKETCKVLGALIRALRFD